MILKHLINMKTYKYFLDRSSERCICPNCGKKTFVLYINNNTFRPLSSRVGKCDRINICGFHYTPSEYFNDKNKS